MIYKVSNGKVIIDAEQASLLAGYRWFISPSGYAVGSHRENKSMTLMHRLMLGAVQSQLIDHVNGDKLDNRIKNLRFSNKEGNALNAKIRLNNTSGVKGVAWNKAARKWIAQIGYTKHGTYKYLGSFDDKEKARIVYESVAQERIDTIIKRHTYA